MGHYYSEMGDFPPSPEQREAERLDHEFRIDLANRVHEHSKIMQNGQPTSTRLLRVAGFLQLNGILDTSQFWHQSRMAGGVAEDYDEVAIDQFTFLGQKFDERYYGAPDYVATQAQANDEIEVTETKSDTQTLKRLHSSIPIMHLILPEFYIPAESEYLRTTLLEAYGHRPGLAPKNILKSDDAVITHVQPFIRDSQYDMATCVAQFDGQDFLVKQATSYQHTNHYRVVRIN